jgi:hypothetical protein
MYRIENRPIVFWLGIYMLASLFSLLFNGPGIDSVMNFGLIGTGCLLAFIYSYYFGLLR